VFPGQSGGVQSQIISGFKFLGLITDDGTPTDSLRAIAVKNEGARKAALKKIVEDKYATLIALNLQKTTPSQLADQMRASYGISGDTLEKATRFFLSAVGYLGLPVSTLFKTTKTANGAPAMPRKRRVTTPRRTPDVDDEPPAQTEGESRSIQLKSGGRLTLAASTKFFELERADRDFVFDLLDKLREYERANPTEADE
jgi:hypothetical protein